MAGVKNCPENSGQLSLLTTEKGGIIDDMIFMNTRWEIIYFVPHLDFVVTYRFYDSRGYLYLVLNAGCAKKDIAYLSKKALEFQKSGKAVQIAFVEAEERALLALQGLKFTIIPL